MTRHVDETVTYELHPALKRQQEEMSMPSEIEAVAAEAWKGTKDKADPEFADCAANFREKLVTHAASVRDHGLVAEGASDFDKKVDELLKKSAAKAKAKAKAKEK